MQFPTGARVRELRDASNEEALSASLLAFVQFLRQFDGVFVNELDEVSAIRRRRETALSAIRHHSPNVWLEDALHGDGISKERGSLEALEPSPPSTGAFLVRR